MVEKRKCKRVKADLKLTVSSLFKQNNVNVEHVDAPITVTIYQEAVSGSSLKVYFQKDIILMRH